MGSYPSPKPSLETQIDDALDAITHAATADDAAAYARTLPRNVLVGVADLLYVDVLLSRSNMLRLVVSEARA